MKNLYAIALIAFFCLLSCETETPNSFQTINTTEQHATRGIDSFGYPDDQIVVQYDAGLTEAEKQIMRDEYGVENYKNCTCADPTLELWIFDNPRGGGPGGSIEETLVVIKDDEGLEGADFNPFIKHDGTKLQNPFGPADLVTAMSKVTTGNGGVTIAVLDTGVDYNYFGFTAPFLYNTSQSANSCSENGQEDYYGWDFVNQDNDPYDDYGHGTIVSSIITDRLFEANVNFQILPVKVFDENGDGNYFDILCGFKYAVNNEDVDIVNMSFGWYNAEYQLLGRFIEESETVALLNTSAGNNTSDNDIYAHFPSSYETSNILANAALAEPFMGAGLAYFSNWGENSVDIAAPGSNLTFYLNQNETIIINGTSYANAIVSAFAGVLYQQGMTTLELRNAVLDEAVYHPNLDNIKHSSYILY